MSGSIRSQMEDLLGEFKAPDDRAKDKAATKGAEAIWKALTDTEPKGNAFLKFLKSLVTKIKDDIDTTLWAVGQPPAFQDEAINRFISNLLLSEETPDLVRHCVGAVGAKHGGDTSKAFALCVAQMQKSGYLKPGSMELTATGKEKNVSHQKEPDAKKKFSGYEKMLKKSRSEGVQGYKLPFFARTKTSDGEQWFRATGTLKNGNFSGTMLDAGAAGRSSSKAKKSTLDAKWARQSWDEVDADEVPPKIKSALGEDVVSEGQTYALAQKDIMAGLEKDGWALKAGLKVPQAVSPDGSYKLFFKAQAIYLGKGDSDLGGARSLHLPDIRGGSYEKFKTALARWTSEGVEEPDCFVCDQAEAERATLRRLAGIDIYPDRQVAPVSETGKKFMDARMREYAGLTGKNQDWTLGEAKGWACLECGKKFKSAAAAMKAQDKGCPKCGGTDIDLEEQQDVALWNADGG